MPPPPSPSIVVVRELDNATLDGGYAMPKEALLAGQEATFMGKGEVSLSGLLQPKLSGLLGFDWFQGSTASLALSSYCVSSIGMTVLNKYVLSSHHFYLNFFLLFLQVIVCL